MEMNECKNTSSDRFRDRQVVLYKTQGRFLATQLKIYFPIKISKFGYDLLFPDSGLMI